MARGNPIQFAAFFWLALSLSLPHGLAQDPIFIPPKKDKSSDPSAANANAADTTIANAKPSGVNNLAVPPATHAKLSPAIAKEIDSVVIPALTNNDDQQFLRSFLRLIEKLDGPALNAAQARVEGSGLSMKARFAELLLDAIDRDVAVQLPEKLKLASVEFINSGIQKAIDEQLQDLSKLTVMQDPLLLPGDWRDCEQAFNDSQSWDRRMTNYTQVAQLGVELQSNVQKWAKKKQDQQTLARLELANEFLKQIQHRHRVLMEREMELRIAELTKAQATLKSSREFSQQLSAALVLERHGKKLAALFEKIESGEIGSGKFLRPSLNDPMLATRCEDLLETGREYGKDILLKARLLESGTGWWLRGRYGAGPLAEGLLKDVDATQSETSLVGVYMPKSKPAAIGSVDEENNIAPGYDRRHYYTWAVENQGLVSNFGKIINANARGQRVISEYLRGNSYWSELGEDYQPVSTSTRLAENYSKRLSRQSGTIPHRLVGSYEYLKSLEAFEQLIKISTPGEIKVYDEILKDRPELTFYNGASAAFEQRPNLVAANELERKQFEIKFKKYGLDWMMALARVELGATLSIHGRARRPFEEISSSDYDVKPYLEILQDDVVTHMKSLANEPGFKTVTQRSRRADTWTLAYLRRLKLVRDMLGTLETVGGPEVEQAIAPYDRELRKYTEELVSRVMEEYQASQNPETSSPRSGPPQSNSNLDPCIALLNSWPGSGVGD